MKLFSISLLLVLPAAVQSYSFQESFNSIRDAAADATNLDGLKHNLQQLREKIPKVEIPAFVKQFTDPVGVSPLLSLHRDLVQIDSTTGFEGEASQFLVDYLTAHNLSVETQLVTRDKSSSANAGRNNVFAYIGRNRSTRVLATSHIDAVPPFTRYEHHGHKISGRGSVDAKGSIATQIMAFFELWEKGEIAEGDVSLLFVVGEEDYGDGMRAANDLGGKWESVIFGEPTELKLATGHKGLLAFTLKTKGKASHSGYPELGINANSRLIPALCALNKLELPHSEKLGNSTLNIGKIVGGSAANVISASAYADVAVRIAEGTAKEMKDLIQETVEKAADDVEIDWWNQEYGPVELSTDIEGFQTIVVSYGTDIPNLKGDHKKYLYGPGSILVAHSDHEQLTIQDLHDAVKGYKKLIRESLHPTNRKSVDFPDADAQESFVRKLAGNKSTTLSESKLVVDATSVRGKAADSNAAKASETPVGAKSEL